MNKKNMFLIIVILALLALAVTLLYFPKDDITEKQNVTESNDRVRQSPETILNAETPITYSPLKYNDIELDDQTVYDDINNICTTSRKGMTIDVYPCKVQDVDGKEIAQYVDFKWNGAQTQNISWIFVYENTIESGSIELLKNVSIVKNVYTEIDQWISDYVIAQVTSYEDLGSPDENCEIGNTNNTRMFSVTRNNGTEFTKIYCFTEVSTINATAFSVSGNIDSYESTQVYDDVEKWVDITNTFNYMGYDLLGEGRSFYNIDKSSFGPNQEIKTKWIYTPHDSAINGKWYILGYDGDTELNDALNSDNYIYVDPWWDNSWLKKRQYNLTESLDSGNNQNRSEGWNEIVAGLDVTNCTNEIRVLDATETYEIPSYAIHINSTACDIYFKHVKNDTTTNTVYYIYYNNPSATYPNYVTNLSLFNATYITNQKYNATWNSGGFGSSSSQDWFMQDLETTFNINADGFVVKGTNENGRLMSVWDGDTQTWSITSQEVNPIFIRIGIKADDGGGYYNITFFHDVDFWKYNDFYNFTVGGSGMRNRMSYGVNQIKCINYRTGNDTYTFNCADINDGLVQHDSYYDYRLGGDNDAIFFTWKNNTGDPTTDYNNKLYKRKTDLGDPQGSVSGSNFIAPSTDINGWDYLYMGFVNGSSGMNDTGIREQKFWTLRSPPVSSLGEEISNENAPSISLNIPNADQYFSYSNITFNCSATDDNGLYNLTLVLDTVNNYTITNTTGAELFLGMQVYRNLTEGVHNYTCIASDVMQVSTGSIRTFTIDLTAPSVTITSPDNITYYDNIVYQNSTNITFTWTVTDSNIDDCWYFFDTDFYPYQSCFQEFANVSTACGGLNTGNYATASNYFYINYTKPSGANSAVWQVKHGYNLLNDLYNVSILQSCFNNGNDVQLRFYGSDNGCLGYGQCYNGTWNNITNISDGACSCGASPGSESRLYDGDYNTDASYNSIDDEWNLDPDAADCYSAVYEEAIIWGFPETTTNATYVTCTDNNATITNITYGPHTILFFANDSAQNENTDNVSFNQNYYAFVNSVNYDSPVYETNNESISINLTYDPNLWNAISARIVYNGTNYTATSIGSSTNKLFTSIVNVPSIIANQNVSFYWSILLNNVSGTYAYNTQTYTQEVNNITFIACDATYTTKSVNFSIWEEGTLLPLVNSSLEGLFYYSGRTIDGTYKTYNYSDIDDDNQSFTFCIDPDFSTFYVSGVVSYYTEDYDRREYFMDNMLVNNLTQNISLYLSSTNVTDIVTFHVVDQNENDVVGAYIRVQRWNIGEDSFYTVGMLNTNEDGEGIINLRLYDTWYRQQVIYNGTLYLTTEPAKISDTDIQLQINLEEANPYLQFDNTAHSLTFNNLTNVTVFTFAELSGSIQRGCLRIKKIQANSTSLYYNQCLSSTSGTLSYFINDTGTFVIQGILQLDSNYSSVDRPVDELIVRLGINPRFAVVGRFGQFISLLLVGTAALIGVAAGSIPLGLFLIVAALVGVDLIGWLNVTETVLYGIVSILILIAFTIKKKGS